MKNTPVTPANCSNANITKFMFPTMLPPVTIAVIGLLTGCQTMPLTTATGSSHALLSPEQSQKLLISTLKNSLYRNQDWVAQQQLFLNNAKNPSDNPDKNGDTIAQPSRLKHIEQCQTEHDTALVNQLKSDKITTYKTIKKLSDDKKIPYDTIKNHYIECYHTAKNLPDSTDTKDTSTVDLERDSPSESENDYPENISIAMKMLGFKSGQVANFNNFFAKSGNLIYTGNYRPYQGTLALQIDAGFENKNLRSHYRLPMIADLKNQTLYVKPDVIMPYAALYLDNKLGMSWQDKWYQFGNDPQQALPANITAKAWLKAITDSFLALPSEQFNQALPAEINAQVLPNLGQSSQQPSQNITNTANTQVIHWHQTTQQQIALTNATISRYITLVESNLTKDGKFLALPTSEQSRYRTLWEKQKKQLQAYVTNSAIKSAPVKNEVENSDDKGDTSTTFNKIKNPRLASRPQGQDWYFVVANNQLKHIYIDNAVTIFQQPVKVHTWVTFSPDNRTLAIANQPQTLDNLAKTLRPEVIIDGRAELKRLVQLDDSRRLFGQEPAVVKYYKDYLKKPKQKAAKESNE